MMTPRTRAEYRVHRRNGSEPRAFGRPPGGDAGGGPRQSSPDAYEPTARLDQLGGIVPHTILEHEHQIADLGRPPDRVALDYHQIGELPLGHASKPLVLTEHRGAVQRHDLDGFDGGEASLDEKLVISLVTEAGQGPPVSGRVHPSGEQATRPHKFQLELLRLPKDLG